MSEMKDSGITWCGHIPVNWNVMPNKYVMYKKKELCPVYKGEDILSLTMDGVIVRDLEAGGKMPATFDGYQIVHPNNLLMCLFDYDVTPRCIGLIKNEGLTSPAYSQFVLKNGNSPKYYYYYYLMIDNTKELLHLAKNLRHSFTEDQLGAINAPVPPVEEQEKIASFLDTKCAEIDKLHADIEKQVKTLEEYKKSVITEAVTKGLNPDAEIKASGIEWLGEMPSHWDTTRIGYESWIRARLGWKGLKAEEYVTEGHPFLSAFNIIENKMSWDELNYITDERYDESPEIMLKVGDIILVKDGAGIGKCARITEFPLGTATTNGSLAVISPSSKNLDYNYLYFYLQSAMFQNYIIRIMNGMGVPHLSQEELRKIKIPFPPINEQIEIAKYLELKRIEIDDAILEKKEQLEILDQYKKSLIYEYVTGKKEVPDHE